MAKPKKTLYHSELVQLGPVEVEIKSDVLQSQYRGHNDYVIMTLDGFDRNYECENDECVKALDKLKGQTVIIEAIGSRDEAEIIVSEATGGRHGAGDRGDRRDARGDDRRNDSRREERTDRRQERREEAPPRDDRRQEHPAQPQRPAPATQQRRYQPLGVTVGMAINNACQHLIAQGKPLEPKVITEIASDILRVAKWLEAGNLIPKAAPSGSPGSATHSAPQKPAQEKPASAADQTAGQSKNAEAPQPGPHEPPPDDDVPF